MTRLVLQRESASVSTQELVSEPVACRGALADSGSPCGSPFPLPTGATVPGARARFFLPAGTASTAATDRFFRVRAAVDGADSPGVAFRADRFG